VLYVGALTRSQSYTRSSFSSSAATTASALTVTISNVSCSDCSAESFCHDHSSGAVYGGSLSAVHFGAHTFSYNNGASLESNIVSNSTCKHTRVYGLRVSINASAYSKTSASSGACFYSWCIVPQHF
jgi:hypothetical protein